MFRTSSGVFLCFCSVATAGLLSTSGCLVSDEEEPPPPASAGTGGGGGSGGSGGAPTAECTYPPPAAESCEGMGVPVDGVLIDFSTFASDGKWGNSSAGDLTGGTSLYRGPDMAAPNPVNTPDGTSLHTTATIPAMGYAGNVFWFGPCVNTQIFHDDAVGGMPTNFTGLTFTVSGVMGGAKLSLQVQTNANYPVSPGKGACTVYTSCDSRWNECVPPKTSIDVTEEVQTISLPWASFTGGMPNAAVTPEQLVGLQFQLECQSETECAVDMTIGTISFTTG